MAKLKVTRESKSSNAPTQDLKWYALTPLMRERDLSINGEESGDDPPRYLLEKGINLDLSVFSKFKWSISVDGPAGDLLGNNLGWLIMSNRARECFSIAGSEIQWLSLPADILGSKMSRGGYWLANILKIQDAMDIPRSELRWDRNEVGRKYIAAVYKIALKPGRFWGYIFRLLQTPPNILVHRKIVQACKRTGIKELYFEEAV